MQKLTKKELENLTKEQSFDYAKELDFKNVPKLVIDLLSRHSMGCIRYIEETDYKNIPKKMTYKLSQNGRDSYWYARKLNFKDIPKIITDRIAMYPFYSWLYTKNVRIKKKIMGIDSIKLPKNILNTAKNSGLYNRAVLKKGNMFTFDFKDEIEPGNYYKVYVNKCPDELNKEIMEKVFEEENPHVWFNLWTDFPNFLPFEFIVNDKKYLCICEYMNEYTCMDIVITEYTEPKIKSFSIREIKSRLWESHLINFFFGHLAKIITDNKSVRVSHWIKELWLYCSWIQYDRIKPDNKTISYNLMREYFFGGWSHNYEFFKRDLYSAYKEIKKVKPEIQDKSNDRLAFVKFKMFLRKTIQLLSKQQLTEEKITVLAKQYLI